MFGISLEYCCSWVMIWKAELHTQVYSAKHCWIKILFPICCTYQHHVCCRLKAINFSQQSWKNPSAGFMHVRRSISCQCIYFVNEYNYFSHSFASFPHLRKLLLTFSIQFTHYCFNRNIYQRDFHLLGNNLSTCGLSSARWTLKQYCLGSIGFIFHSCIFRYFIINFRIGQSQQNSFFNRSLLCFIAC